MGRWEKVVPPTHNFYFVKEESKHAAKNEENYHCSVCKTENSALTNGKKNRIQAELILTALCSDSFGS